MGFVITFTNFFVELDDVLCLYLFVRLQFVSMIAANEPELSIRETFARSMALTQGRFWQLFGYGVASVCISIVGLLVFIVGGLYANVIVNLMQAHVFKVLSDEHHSLNR